MRIRQEAARGAHGIIPDEAGEVAHVVWMHYPLPVCFLVVSFCFLGFSCGLFSEKALKGVVEGL